ncbi:LacI family DNA-binding transcriptional regulator [Companilactobacillus huachuanensis]|uniref:LacI family DNA-binding transcriptional regulator n=1 Tax=Companilactobacillus huachuanensis TaxID=2559914 RepID=A0ABW1RQG2_9LACO|nr:LacI family DNA-binding transcriptional regulator [Companilactobacillus huachuanensis]
MKITMQTIADRLGVSKNTVSQALRGKNTVSEQTKKDVLRTAERLGYKYESSTNNEPVVKGTRFALVASDLTLSLNSFFGVILNRIKEQILANNQELDLYSITSQEEEKLIIPSKLKGSDYDGIFILSYLSSSYLNELSTIKTPKILIDHHQPNLNIDSVLTANVDGTIESLYYLKKNNIQKIGFIGDNRRSPSYQERFTGFKLAMDALNLQTSPDWIINQLQEDQNSLFVALEKIKNPPEAWFCVNNGYALSLINFYQSHGKQIPQDIKVISFDDTDLSRLTNPGMTVMATNLKEMGTTAYELLQYRIIHPHSDIRQISLKPHLIMRGTV